MSRSSKAEKRPTWTGLTVKALREADDFMSMEMLLAATGASGRQMRVTIAWLTETKVVEAVEGNGKLWWFLTGDDQRQSHVEERVPEPEGNRGGKPRKSRAKGPVILPAHGMLGEGKP